MTPGKGQLCPGPAPGLAPLRPHCSWLKGYWGCPAAVGVWILQGCCSSTPAVAPPRRLCAHPCPSPRPHHPVPIPSSPSPHPHHPVPITASPSPHPHHPVPITLHPTALPPGAAPTRCSQYHTKTGYWDEAGSRGGSCGAAAAGRLVGWDNSPSPPATK